MKIEGTSIPDVLVLTPKVFNDERGTFAETFNQNLFDSMIGQGLSFVQDNQSISKKGVLRGLHLQSRKPQGKLIRVTQGEIYDVFVDCRPTSASLGKYSGLRLTAESFQQLWIPPGFAHGFLTLSENATIQYKVTDYYDPGFEVTLAWNDPLLSIDWPISSDPNLSEKDAKGIDFKSVIERVAKFQKSG
jgi:dTDP-4-dehydrorhamnose 3,5-epimerase